MRQILEAKQRGERYAPELWWQVVNARWDARELADASSGDAALRRDGGSNAATAVEILAQNFRDSGNTTGKGNHALLGTCGSPGSDTAEDAWYRVTITGGGTITAWTTCADVGPPSFDTRLGIFDENLTLIACNDDDPTCGGANYQSRIGNLQLGDGTYYVVVDGWGGTTGPYELNVQWTANGAGCEGSNASTATLVDALPFVDANDSSDDCDDVLVTCELGGSSSGPDHWYSVSVDVDVYMDVSTVCDGASIDTRIAVLDGLMNVLYCSDDDPACGTYQSRIENALLGAGTYYVVVDAATALGGTYTVQVDTTHAPPGSVNELLPDIVTLADALYDHDVVTDSGTGRTYLRFSNSTANVGSGKLYLYGEEPANPDGTQNVRQRIWRDDGSVYDRDAGTYVYHPEHGHIHLEDWSEYRLRFVTPGDGVGDVLIKGQKTSFCILDLEVHDPGLPGFDAAGEFHTCGSTVQGLSIGWADIYGKSLPGQSLDITDIADGEYWLESVVDPTNSVRESDESNNTTRIKITIGTPGSVVADSYEPNDSRAQLDARAVGSPNSPVLGPCGPLRVIPGLTVHANGNDDYFRFVLVAPGAAGDEVRIDFVNADGNLDLELIDAAGNVVGASATTADGESISLEGHSPGWYDVRVHGFGGAMQSSYSLTIDPSQNSTPTVTVIDPPAGDTSVGHGFENYTVTWSVDDAEGNETWVSVYLNAIAGFDGNEILLPTSVNTAGALGAYVINTASVAPGTYFVFVEATDGGSVGGAWSTGTLTLTDTTSVPGRDVAGITRLLASVPNPFNPSTTVRLELAREAQVSWRIYDLRGQLVRTLLRGPMQAGRHELRWDGRDDAGRAVASGVYLNAVDAGGFVGREKLLLLK